MFVKIQASFINMDRVRAVRLMSPRPGEDYPGYILVEYGEQDDWSFYFEDPAELEVEFQRLEGLLVNTMESFCL